MTGSSGGPGESEEVGSVAEEAAKLISSLQGWAQEAGSAQAGAASGVGDSFRQVGDHIGHGPDCRFCPLCQLIGAVRGTSPEVKEHLAIAANSLLQAVQGMLATQVPDGSRSGASSPIEKIEVEEGPDPDAPN